MKRETLLAVARAARLKAYAPYSRFPVGAALLTGEGNVITGSNIENSSLGLTVCAERLACWTAVHYGYRRFSKIAIVADCTQPPVPCGACRQVIWEITGNIEVIMGNLAGEMVVMPLLDLLPEPYGGAAWADNPVGRNREEEEDLWRLPVSFTPIGYVANNILSPKDIPDNYRELISQIILDPEMEEGLYRVDEEEKITVIAYLHQSRGFTLKDRRRGRGNEIYGIFACHSPHRPNAIAQSTGEIMAVDRNRIMVRGLDLINGTPVLDLKTIIN
ncbi:MAG: cytidine deaminase [Bacillota bacterium]|nr:cytidine deaminase [Bacillota bacterium]